MAEEVWKPIDGFPGYEVSNLGRVRSFHNNRYGVKDDFRILKASLDKTTGYLKVSLWKNNKGTTKPIHKLVADSFLPKCGPKTDVNHIDGNKLNNRVSNLEFVTRSENMKHAYSIGLATPTDKNGKAVRIIETGETFKSLTDCAKAIDGHERSICMCLNDKYDRTAHKGLHFEYVDQEVPEKPKGKPFLYDYQLDAVKRLKNGSILCGSVGSGKSRTGLFYYYQTQGGWIDENGRVPMKDPCDLYIITTAKKRNSCEWVGELSHFMMSNNPEVNTYNNKIVIDSWNNIMKYKDVTNAFFLLDEQRLVGSGAWVKSFLKIAKSNQWILLTATPGDSYLDYLPIFLANGFFKNKTEFNREHVIFSRFTKYPKVDRFVGTQRLDRLRNRVLVQMNYRHKIETFHEDIYCRYDISAYKDAFRTRFDPFKKEPIQQASGLCFVLRRIVNSDESRQMALLEVLEDYDRAIIFYSFDYELEILRNIDYGQDVEIAEYNGHKHQPIPEGPKWVYLCQYTSACEGWECIRTNCIIFYSQSYSYKVMTQAAGRIDRLNTPYTDLHYYHLKSRSGIDLAISKALSEKRQFNETRWVKW